MNKKVIVVFLIVFAIFSIGCGKANKYSYVAKSAEGSALSKELKYADYTEQLLIEGIESMYDVEEVYIDLIPIKDGELEGLIAIYTSNNVGDEFCDNCEILLSKHLKAYRIFLNDEEISNSFN